MVSHNNDPSQVRNQWYGRTSLVRSRFPIPRAHTLVWSVFMGFSLLLGVTQHLTRLSCHGGITSVALRPQQRLLRTFSPSRITLTRDQVETRRESLSREIWLLRVPFDCSHLAVCCWTFWLDENWYWMSKAQEDWWLSLEEVQPENEQFNFSLNSLIVEMRFFSLNYHHSLQGGSEHGKS